MNGQLEAYARATLKDGLSQLTPDNYMLFKRMYSHNNLHLSIDEVVDKIPADKLDWAMQQVQNTIDKAATRRAESAVVPCYVEERIHGRGYVIRIDMCWDSESAAQSCADRLNAAIAQAEREGK